MRPEPEMISKSIELSATHSKVVAVGVKVATAKGPACRRRSRELRIPYVNPSSTRIRCISREEKPPPPRM